MVAALECYLDTEAARRVGTLWDALEAEGVPTLRDLTHRRHRPHVSLTVAQRLDAVAVRAALDGLSPCPQTPVSFDFVGQFVGRVLWLGPAPSMELLRRTTVEASTTA